ncbi:MAG: radical SAM protein, partial [Planctomycetota bacterium]
MNQTYTLNRPTVGLIDLGCAKNTIDSESILGTLLSESFDFAADVEQADLVLINTCGFIQSAKEESIEHILEFVELAAERPSMKVAVVGCLVERYGDDLRKDIPEINGLLGLSSYDRIVEYCQRIVAGEVVDCFGGEKRGVPEGSPRLILTGSSFGYLRIAEGCDNCCTFCSVPSIRGTFRSRPQDRILAEAQTLVDSGLSELCLVAQDPGHYGMDLSDGENLPGLLRKLLSLSPSLWLRL